MKDNTFFLNFGFALFILLGYFIAMLVISLDYTSRIKLVTQEMNLVSQAESYLAFAQNVQREMIYDPNKRVLGYSSFEVARDSLEILYGYDTLLQNSHFDNRKVLNEEYKAYYEVFFKTDVCTNNMTLHLDLLPFKCQNYIYAKEGMQTILTRYFESLKDSLKTYVNLRTSLNNDTEAIAKEMVNSPFMKELYVLQFRFISNSLRLLVSKLT